MRTSRICFSIVLSIAILSSILLLGSCDPIPTDYVNSGDYFRVTLTSEMLGGYEVKLNSNNPPTVNISYTLTDSTAKTAVFKLDGYDTVKNIGYKLVLKKDKEEWDKNHTDSTPDMNDAILIQQAAAGYQFPVVFMWAYQYQDQLSQNQIDINIHKFVDDFRALMKTSGLAKWAYDGLYSGEWVKEGIEKAASYSFDTHFIDTDAPTVNITYGNNKQAVFQLDGYDPDMQIGYKFVTGEDIDMWSQQRLQGNLEVPNLSDLELIKQALKEYKFTVILLYVPEYWNSNVKEIVDQNFYPAMWGLENDQHVIPSSVSERR